MKNKFTRFTSRAVVLALDDIDTDQIIPSRFLKATDSSGIGQHLFADWRYNVDGSPKPDFVLNAAAPAGAEILIAGRNFGCGSSREHAAWALAGFGFRAIIGLSFADIFRQNALKNGLLPVVVDETAHAWILDHPGVPLTIDLASQILSAPGGLDVGFPIDPFSKTMLMEGLDELGYLLRHADSIAAFEHTLWHRIL